MKISKNAVFPAVLVAGFAIVIAASPARAAVTIVDDGTTAPSASTQEISQLSGGGVAGNPDGDYEDQSSNANLPLELFTPTTTFTLGSVTLSGDGGYSLSPTDTFLLQIDTNPPATAANGYMGNSLTQIASYSAPIGTIATNTDDFFTFTGLSSDTPVVLTAGTTYAFVLTQTGPGNLTLDQSTAPVTATGDSFNQADNEYNSPGEGSYGTLFYSDATGDRTFEIGAASAAPEPSQVGMLALIGFGLGGLLLRARKSRAGRSLL